MLFVRNPTGVSHSPAEHAERDDCLAGVDALAAVLADLAADDDRLLVAEHALAARTALRAPTCCFDGRPTAGSPRSRAERRRRPATHRLPGLVLPGFANCHCHAFHRALRGRTHDDGGTFWTWREQMYARRRAPRPGHATSRWPGRPTPRWRWPGSPRSASSTTCTTPPAGGPYADPNAMGEALRAGRRATPASGSPCSTPATSPAGSTPTGTCRSTTCSAASATATPTRGRRGSAALADDDGTAGRRGDPLGARRAARRARRRCVAVARRAVRCTCTCPSSRPRTSACLAVLRRDARPRCSPTPACSARAPPRCTPPTSTATTSPLLGGIGTDRVPLPDHRARPRRRHRPGPRAGRRRRRRSRSAPTSTPSSTCSRRRAALEMHERLRSAAARPVHARPSCSRRARPRHAQPRLARRRPARGRRAAPTWSRSASTRVRTAGRDARAGRCSPRRRADVDTVVVDGRIVVRGGVHRARRRRRAARRRDRRRRPAMTRLLVTGIGELVTNDPAVGRHAARRAARRRARRRRRPRRLGRAGAATPRPPTRASTSAAGRSCPGFVDTPHPPGVRRRPGRGVRRPDGRRALRRRRHRRRPSPPPAPRPTTSCARLLAGARRRVRAQGTTTVEIKSGYGLTVDDEARLLRLAARGHRRDDVPRRARRAARASTAPTTSRSSPARCSPPARRTPAGSTCSASRPARTRSTATRRARCSLAGPRAGPRAAGARQPARARARASQLAVELGAASVDHCTHLTDADVDALAGGDTVATLLPGVEFSTRSPYPDARRLLDAGVDRRAGHRLQPRHLLHLVDAVRHRARGARDAA